MASHLGHNLTLGQPRALHIFMARKYYYQISKTKMFEDKLERPPTLKCTTATATMKSYRTHIGGIAFFTPVQFLNQSTTYHHPA